MDSSGLETASPVSLLDQVVCWAGNDISNCHLNCFDSSVTDKYDCGCTVLITLKCLFVTVCMKQTVSEKKSLALQTWNENI